MSGWIPGTRGGSATLARSKITRAWKPEGKLTAESRKLSLRHSPHHTRQHLGHIVVDHHHSEQDQKHKRRLVDPFFDPQADVSANDAFHKQQQNDATIHDRNGQEVKYPQIEADYRSQFQQRSPAFLAGCLPGSSSDADRPFDGAD